MADILLVGTNGWREATASSWPESVPIVGDFIVLDDARKADFIAYEHQVYDRTLDPDADYAGRVVRRRLWLDPVAQKAMGELILEFSQDVTRHETVAQTGSA